ncbi:hypothetical protein ACUXMM_002464, partial [Micrococcus aloeverae]
PSPSRVRSAVHPSNGNRRLTERPDRMKGAAHREEQTAKGVFGTYNALAVIAHLLPSIDADTEWAKQLAALLREFPVSHALTIGSMGAPHGWEALDLWRS